VALQNLDVTFGIDRAGLVGQDGPTHHGAFDLSYLRCIPNMLIAAPSDENECRKLLQTCYEYQGPAAVRYPRGNGPGALIEQALATLPIGESLTVRQGKKVAIVNFGTLLGDAIQAANQIDATVVDMRWVKPMDTKRLRELAATHELIVTLEENAIAGGAGAGVLEFMAEQGIKTDVITLGLPDRFIDHGDHKTLLAECGLSAEGIQNAIAERMAHHIVEHPAVVPLR